MRVPGMAAGPADLTHYTYYAVYYQQRALTAARLVIIPKVDYNRISPEYQTPAGMFERKEGYGEKSCPQQ